MYNRREQRSLFHFFQEWKMIKMTPCLHTPCYTSFWAFSMCVSNPRKLTLQGVPPLHTRLSTFRDEIHTWKNEEGCITGGIYNRGSFYHFSLFDLWKKEQIISVIHTPCYTCCHIWIMIYLTAEGWVGEIEGFDLLHRYREGRSRDLRSKGHLTSSKRALCRAIQ